MCDEITADENHDDERQPDDREGCQDGAKACCPLRITSMEHRCVAYIGGTVDADRTRSRLTNRHDVGKLGIGQPVVLDYCLIVNEG